MCTNVMCTGTRPTGCYTKPIWLRPGVLQLLYDDDNDRLRCMQCDALPGGHAAYTRTATVYSQTEITDDDLKVASTSPMTEKLRSCVAAYVQRVRSCYLIEANLLGFASAGTGVQEQAVLSSAIRWALSDFIVRNGKPPDQIVLHLDVNGSLALGDVAGSKSMHKMAKNLARDVFQRYEQEFVQLSDQAASAVERARDGPEGSLAHEYTVAYSGNDFVRSVMACQGALAVAAIREIEADMAIHANESFADKFNSASTRQASVAMATSLERPALTVAIRTNGVEHRQAAVYVQRMLMGVCGIELSEEKDTVRRYVVTHEDVERGLFFHPVLLEKLHKSDGTYSFEDYARELQEVCGQTTSAEAWQQVPMRLD